MLESNLVESTRNYSLGAYRDQITNMREVTANFKHRQEWRSRYFPGHVDHAHQNRCFAENLSQDHYDFISNGSSINEVKRFVRVMTELCQTMDKQKYVMDLYDSCINDMSKSGDVSENTESMIQYYVGCRALAEGKFDLANVLANIKFNESRQTGSLDGDVVRDTVTTLYSIDDERTQVNAWRDTVKNMLAQGVEKLRQTELNMFNGRIQKASASEKASSSLSPQHESTQPEQQPQQERVPLSSSSPRRESPAVLATSSFS